MKRSIFIAQIPAIIIFILSWLFYSLPVYADTTGPVISILSPVEGKTVWTTGNIVYPIKVVFSASDVGGDTPLNSASFQLGVDGVWGPLTGLNAWGNEPDSYYYDWVPASGTKNYLIQIRGNDNAANTGFSRKINVDVKVQTLGTYSTFPGDGTLLVRDNDNTLCISCHELKSHSASSTESVQYGSWERVCRDCHTPHNTRNIFLLHSSFRIYTGDNQGYAYNRKVDFRNLSGESNFGFVSSSGSERRGPCEVCHTRTKNSNGTPRWRNYTSEADTDGNKHNAGLSCIDCHAHKEGFKAGESGGDTSCSGCHANLFDPMNQTAGGYHHYLNNADVSTLASGSKYPVKVQPVAVGNTSDQDRRCLMCHVEHDIFRVDLNPSSPGRAYNLRPDISALPGTTSGRNTDYISAETNGGICLSCHATSQTKSYTQPDGSTVTPVITKTLFDGSPHNFTAPAIFSKDSSQFNGNCIKCHNDNLTKSKQSSVNQFGLHEGDVRRLNGAMENDNNTGNASSATASTLVDSSKTWGTDIWQYMQVKILSGSGSGQTRNISSNGSSTLNIAPDWTTTPDSSSVYLINISRGIDPGVSSGGNSATTLNDTNQVWINNYWVDRPVSIIGGTGKGQTRKINANTATQVTVSAAWSITPDSTSRYTIGDPMEEELCFFCHSPMSNPNAEAGSDYYGVKTFASSKVIKMEKMFFGNGESGTVTVGSTPGDDFLTDGTKAWATDEWAGMPVKITGGDGSGQVRTVVSNTATTLTVTPVWSERMRADRSNYYVGAGNPIRHGIKDYKGIHRSDEAINAPSNTTATGWFADASGGVHVECHDCHNPHGTKKAGNDYGTAESGTVGSLTDSDKGWSQDQWRGYLLKLMNGTGLGQERMITSNSATVLNIGAAFDIAPASDTYYIILPVGHYAKGNDLSNPNNGIWGVDVNYTYSPTLGNYTSPDFTKNTELAAGTDKIYGLCFKCHSNYGWGSNGTPFNIPDSLTNTLGTLTADTSTNIAEEFNPKNLGHHPVVSQGNNQPIMVTGDTADNIGGPYSSSGNAGDSLGYSNAWSANQYVGYCVEITSGTLLGQIRSIMSHDTADVFVDPPFSATPANGSAFYIRKCSVYNIGANYSGTGSIPWPRFTGGTLNLTNGSSTATITDLTNGIPSSVINGWYLYAGALRTGANANDTPNAGACSATAKCPPMFATSGWFQVTGLSAGASDSGRTSVTLTISPAATADYSGAHSLSAGLGNTMVPPYGPWSVIGCADCHDSDNPDDPSGPHASSSNWMVKRLERQAFPWYYGGETTGNSTDDATLVKTIAWGDGSATWTGASGNMSNYFCLNCHRADVYGYEDNDPVSGGTVPSASEFSNFAFRIMSRLPHYPDGRGHPGDSDSNGNDNAYGISCMYCHAGDARTTKSAGTMNEALGGLHGSNLGKGAAGGLSYRGRRLLNGATWLGVTRATTQTAVQCWMSTGSVDGVNGCNRSHAGTSGEIANYPYFSGED